MPCVFSAMYRKMYRYHVNGIKKKGGVVKSPKKA